MRILPKRTPRPLTIGVRQPGVLPDRFEAELTSAGLAENTVRTYVDRSRYFVR
jgi:hypothetical protein